MTTHRNAAGRARVGVIGLGTIGRSVVEHLPASTELVGVLVRSSQVKSVSGLLPSGVVVVSDIEDLIAAEPDVVAECAGQGALAAYAETLLSKGIDVIAISTGALADDELRARLTDRAEATGARLVVPSGAIAGIDGLVAMQASGIDAASYTSIKPPGAWLGTPAEQVVDLGSLKERSAVFTGNAREAARLFPKNANVAVTVALAAGFDRTAVTLIADPDATENVGIVEAVGPLGTLKVVAQGPASPENARTSAITAFSIIRAIERRTSPILL